jgi:hypothetical protein
MIDAVNAVIDDYLRDGRKLTLRQLYYRLVSRNQIENTQRAYKNLGDIVDDGRKAGLIRWDAIEDRTRYMRELPTWGSPADVISETASWYREDLWLSQTIRIEVWFEKDALIGVAERPCTKLRVPYFACRGNASTTALHEAGMRFRRYLNQDVVPIVLHFGDHDPNGLDMTRDNRDKLAMFTDGYGPVEVRRVALNMDQIEQYNLPPQPAKDTDSRFSGYAERHGTESWELDALDPNIIEELIRSKVAALVDHEAWANAEAVERSNRETLRTVSDDWTEVENFVKQRRS